MAVEISSSANESFPEIVAIGESEQQAVRIYMTFVNYALLVSNFGADTLTNDNGEAYATLIVDVNKFTTLKDIHEYMSDVHDTVVSMSHI